MNIDFAISFLLWCTIINFAILLLWFLTFLFGHKHMRQIHGKWFNLNEQQFDPIHYAGMAIYKIAILVFNLVPLIALYIIS